MVPDGSSPRPHLADLPEHMAEESCRACNGVGFVPTPLGENVAYTDTNGNPMSACGNCGGTGLQNPPRPTGRARECGPCGGTGMVREVHGLLANNEYSEHECTRCGGSGYTIDRGTS